MSHLTKIELEINDLNALKNTCNRLGFKFLENQKTYKWFGKFMGDSPLPEGLSISDLGKCHHAISAPNCSYEIGVVKQGNKFVLLWDYWHSGGLDKKIGTNGGKLKQAYTIEKAKWEATKKGYSCTEHKTEKGIQLRIRL